MSSRADRARLFEIIITRDPEDHAIDVAHGFPAGHNDYDELCRNGCGLPYGEIVAGKAMRCLAPEHTATAEIQAAEEALWAEFQKTLRWR